MCGLAASDGWGFIGLGVRRLRALIGYGRQDFMGGIARGGNGGNGRGCFFVRIGRRLGALFGL